MAPDQGGRRSLHRPQINRFGHVPLLTQAQWIMRRIIPDGVPVLLTDGVETGVEIRLGLRGRRHPNVFR